jgi:putative phage-type endonuclease
MSDNETEINLTFYYDKDLPKPTPLKEEYLRNQVLVLRDIPQPVQKSPEWYTMRETMVSASDWGSIFGISPFSNADKILLSKCGESKFFTNSNMDWGNKYEDVAVKIYEHRNQVQVWEFGCIRHPFISFLGASPDGITPDGIMLEIKCPPKREIDGIPPPYYWCQVQGQLEVAELDRCDFLECNLKEYDHEDAYLEDNFNGNYTLNSFGNEKGIVVEFYRKKEKTFFYDYSPVCIIGDDLENWKKMIIEKHKSNDNLLFSGFAYWYLKDVSCVPIYRNQEWFNNTAKPVLTDFWNDVLKYRELGLDVLKEDIQNKKLEKKREKEEVKKSSKKVSKKSTSSTSSKKQKQIKDFINLDNDNISIDISSHKNKSESDNSSDDDSIFKTNTSLFTNMDIMTDYNEDDDNMILSGKSFFSSDESYIPTKSTQRLSLFSD